METRLAEVERRRPAEAQALHFAFGKAYLDVGDSERAFAHLDAGDRMKRAQFAYDADANRARNRRDRRRLPGRNVRALRRRRLARRRRRSSSSACRARARP